MDRIKFMIDSGSDIPSEVADALDAEVVPLYRVIDGVPVLDYHDFNIQEYSEYLKTCKEIPTTSQPSPEDFLTRYERFADEGYDHIICITMSVHGSGTYNSAVLASEMFKEHHPESAMQIHVVDSWSCSLNMVMELRLANHLLEAGAGIRTILDELYAVREKVRTYYLIDNLEFLIKGGRVSPLKGGIASKLRIKPIVAIKNGEGSIPANAMGYQNGLSKLAHFFWEDSGFGTVCQPCRLSGKGHGNRGKDPGTVPQPQALYLPHAGNHVHTVGPGFHRHFLHQEQIGATKIYDHSQKSLCCPDQLCPDALAGCLQF